MGHIIEELAKFTINTRYEDLPEPVVHEAKNLIMDSIGNGLAAITTDPGKIAISLAKDLGGPPESSIIGTGYKVSCTNAAFANGQLFNALDFDTVMPGGHAPPYIIPTQLAMAERIDASGKDLIIALAGLFNNDEVLNHAIEFVGSEQTMASIPVDDRLAASNMTTEWGALSGLFPMDSVLKGLSSSSPNIST